MVDWQTPLPVEVTSDRVALGFNALFYDKTIGEEESSPEVPDSMPSHTSDHLDKFQTFLSAYTINSFCHSLTEVMDVKGWARASKTQMTTTKVNALLPGIMSYYGAGQPVDIFFQIYQLGDFESFADNQEMQGLATLEMQFWVTTTSGDLEYAAGLNLKDTKFAFIAPIQDMSLTIEVTKLNVDSVDVLYCSFGRLSAVTVKLEINNGFRIVQPALNAALADMPINFPTNIFGIFEMEQLTLAYYDNYVYAGITPVFIDPYSATEEQAVFA